jgi:hypothetical protein
VGLAVLVALLSERAGGPRRTRGLGPTAQPPGIMVGALHVTFAAQAGIALVGAVVALVVIGRGPGLRRRQAERGHVVARALEQQGGTP